ncbi:MAG: O-antigen ligase family protein [Microgenomates group bacterium]
MWEALLFFCLLLGNLGRIQLTPSIAVYAHDVALLLFIVVSLLRVVTKKQKQKAYTLVIPFLSVIIVCIVSLVANSARFAGNELLVGAAYAARFFSYFVLYLVVRNDAHTSTYWLRWLFLLGIGFALLGFAQLYVYPDLRNLSYDGWDPHYYRLFATLLDPNFMGAIFVLSFVAGVAVLARTKEKIWSIAGLAGIFVAFLFTFSRSSYLAAITGLLTYIILSKKWKYLYVLCILCIAIVAVPAIGGESTALFRQLTALARITNWQEGIQLFLKSPIIGHGFNMVGFLPHTAPTLQSNAVAHSATGYDNSIVFILVTTGLVGLGACMHLGSRFIQLGKNAIGKKNHELGILYIALCAAVLVHSMFVNTLFYPQMMLCFWILTAAVEKEGK